MISDAAYTEIYEFRELLYTKYYESGCSDVIRYETETGGVNECVYYYYFPRDTELDASTPVVAWVTHGGGGSGRYCNKYARLYSEAGGTAIIAEINYGDHEAKFLKPIRHNSIGWAAGCGMLAEDVYYKNAWYCYRDGEKIPCTLEEATALLHPARDAPTARRPLCRLPRSR